MAQRIVVLDTETHHLANPRPVEIAWVECDADLNIIHRVESLIDPECAISPGAAGVHGITYGMVADKPTLKEFFTYVTDDPFGYGDIVFVGHQASFDLPMVRPYIKSLGAVVCTLKLARRLYPEAENHKLQTLRYTFGLEAGDGHRAMGDVITTHSLLKRMMADTGMSFQELAAFVNQPQIIERIGFGKHKGTKLADLPTNYIHWLLNEAKIDDDLRFSLQQL